MTWQRIDENTYIDDTLVTCAEYQLFIDEMREQGKYYQPDHWNSYQFPQGQARKPVLGVRLSDAEEFCSWLTKREEPEWFYRLPTLAEVIAYGLKSLTNSPIIGYWFMGEEGKFGLAWVGGKPDDARALTKDRFLQTIQEIIDSSRTSRGFEYINYLLRRPIYPNFNFDLEETFEHARNAPTGYLVEIYFRLEDADMDLAKKRNFYKKESFIDMVLYKAVNDASHTGSVEPVMLNVCVDIYTLRERIAGRSPAFEGIRLVKERK